ncbi:probable receptor-like protein kinase At2g23200 [Argentina anserina]|uniref:probable receptor-like protein kinase At2g23200 n=1 Tax=Argentina anserina TaxID=57926 RepID=UPI0021763CC8|nr:probable receptor-like protein kinase At2g23200 [Potentilla anserina]
METFLKHRTHVLFLLSFLFHFSNLHFLSFADDYYINCGSDANVNLTTGQAFVGQSKSGSSFSNSNNVAATNQLPASLSALYQTARASSDPFYYEFKVTVGTYLVRLHFFAFSSTASNLSAAVFDVLDSSKFTLLNNFSAKNGTSSPLIKEFFLGINSTESFRLYFAPRASSLAFVNAIEFVAVPPDFTNFIPENYASNFPLQTIYRVNVGGPSQNDNHAMWRSWESDDIYLPDPNSAKQINKSTLNRNYVGEIDGLVASNDPVAPGWVYQTAKVMNITASRPANSSNITWSFGVSGSARHIVRAHFCDIVDQPLNVVFYLYSNDILRKEIGSSNNTISTYPGLPFYYDFMVNFSESELIRITIRPNLENATVHNAFLNGLEILEMREAVAPIPNVKESKRNVVALVVGSVLGGLLLICILTAGFVFRSRQRKAGKGVETSDWSPMPENGGISFSRGTERTITGSPMNLMNLGLKISFAEIQSATNKFDTKLLIGKGGFGNVYRGTLLNGTKVAIKRAYKRDEHGSGSGQGRPEFQTEIMVLSKIRHRHLVSLIGYCDERSEMILVYEFMERGTLRDHLYDSNLPHLSWKQRLDISIGAARGLHYLHTGAAGGIIHRDVKSTNILLDENLVAKVADFGLSKSGPLDETHVSTNVKGTFGYLDPEYMMSEQLTEKSDVYSFGVVLLEVLCGRPAIDPTLPREQMNLAEWGMLCKQKGLLDQIVDSPLKNQIGPSSLRKFGETADKCLQEDASNRPTMADVLWELEYALQLQQQPKLKEAHEDSTAIDASSAAFGVPNIQRFPSLGSTVNGDDMRDDELDTTENKIFSLLKISDAR